MPYYAATLPRELKVQYANVQQLDHAPFLGYAYQLWATDGASAASGSWFSVATTGGASRANVPNAYRVQTAKSSVAISHTAGGQSITQFNLEGRFGVTITSFGWTDEISSVSPGPCKPMDAVFPSPTPGSRRIT